MNFHQKHQPATINDLVFQDPAVAQIIKEYASGARTKHLLLEGPTSSGKSEAARMILHERLSPHLGADYTSTYHGQGFDAHTTKQINGDWNIQMWNKVAYSIIDEIDFANADGRREIRKLIDDKRFGTLICTTNHISKLEPAFVSRFYVMNIQLPSASDWHNRAKIILNAEGHLVSLGQVQKIMSNFSGHAREFIDFIEDAHIELLKTRHSASAPVQGASSSLHVHTTGPVSVANSGITLNGATTQNIVRPGGSSSP